MSCAAKNSNPFNYIFDPCWPGTVCYFRRKREGGGGGGGRFDLIPYSMDQVTCFSWDSKQAGVVVT